MGMWESRSFHCVCKAKSKLKTLTAHVTCVNQTRPTSKIAFLNASRKYKGHEALKQDPSTALRLATLFRKQMGVHNCTQGGTSTTLTNHQHADHHEAKLNSKMKHQDSSSEGYRLRV